jgi:uncharacterized protein (DUF1501 family)
MQRRHFIQQAGAVASWTWASGHAAGADGSVRRKLIVIMLRGAVDGLSVVVPCAEPAYAQSRSTIALAMPGVDDGVLKLDSRFGLHPALARLKPLWDQGAMAFVHASGSPDNTRSHFDAQDYLESGTPGHKNTQDGWMNRLLGVLPGPASPTRAVSMGTTPPRIFAGAAPVATLGLGPRSLEAKAIDDPRMQAALEKLYAKDIQLARTYKATSEGRSEMSRSMAGGETQGMDASADNGAASASGFAADARRLGLLLRKDPHTQLAFTSVGGWDTHANQGGAKGQLANRLATLGAGLDALAQGLGDSLRDTVIVVLSEFGRTLRQNGTGGTDHGRGNVIWLIGGPVAGGQVLGEWPGLDSAALVDGRDLAVTTDFRAVLRPLLRQHLGLGEAALEQVFPGFSGALAGQLLRSA